MSLRLRSEIDYRRTLALNSRGWQSMLDLAEDFGWSPMGTVRSTLATGFHGITPPASTDEVSLTIYGPMLEGYLPQLDRMVLPEDALNFADALERAFIYRDPVRRHPAGIVVLSDWEAHNEDLLPGIGVILEVVDICRRGAFWIERI